MLTSTCDLKPCMCVYARVGMILIPVVFFLIQVCTYGNNGNTTNHTHNYFNCLYSDTMCITTCICLMWINIVYRLWVNWMSVQMEDQCRLNIHKLDWCYIVNAQYCHLVSIVVNIYYPFQPVIFQVILSTSLLLLN